MKTQRPNVIATNSGNCSDCAEVNETVPATHEVADGPFKGLKLCDECLLDRNTVQEAMERYEAKHGKAALEKLFEDCD